VCQRSTRDEQADPRAAIRRCAPYGIAKFAMMVLAMASAIRW
jgi:hypothetical protein